jgi:hypothetical protein
VDDALYARIVELLREYSADWIMEAISQSHLSPEPKPKVSDLLAARWEAKTAQCEPVVSAQPEPNQMLATYKATKAKPLPKSKPNKLPDTKPDDWYDHEALKAAVLEVFSLAAGTTELHILNMLRGRATKKSGWGVHNLPDHARMDAQKLRDWAGWYWKTYPEQRMVERAETINKYIMRWWEAGCPTTNPQPPNGARPFESHKRPGPEKYQISEDSQRMLDVVKAKREAAKHEPETA